MEYFLGDYEIEYFSSDDLSSCGIDITDYTDDVEELLAGFRHNDYIYLLSEFILTRGDSKYHAVMGLTNTSAYGVVLNESCDGVSLYSLS